MPNKMPTDEDNRFSSNILECVKLGKIDELEQMVKRGASINEVDKSRDQFTPLHCAAYYGSLECLHWLIWKGADTTMTSPKGWTPTHIAAIRGQYACLQALIQSGVSINVRDHRGQTPAHLAATHGHSHTLQALLRGGADISVQDANGWTPVHTAAYHGRLGCLQFLKTAGGKLDECDNEGNTPVHLAAMEGHLPCLKFLLSNIRGMGNVLQARNDQGDTPKTLAEQFFKSQIVEYLDAVEWERDHPEQAENLSFPAHVAAFNGDINHLKLLIEQGVISINERDDKGCTPAHKAAGQGHLNVLQWLIENGANVNIKNNAGELPRDVAQRFAQLACSKILEAETTDDNDKILKNHALDADDDEKPKDSLRLTHEQKKQAKARAKKKVEEIERLLEIARSNYLQLGGRLEDVQNQMLSREQAQLKTIAELENELECERLRRERLEAQLDQCRQEIEKSVKGLRDYEAKVNIMERYIHTMKLDPNAGSGKKDVKKKKIVKKEHNADRDSARRRSITRAESIQDQYSSTSSLRKFDKKQFDHLNLKESQLNEMKEAFEKLDKRKTGFVDVDDLKLVYEELNIDISEDEIETLLSAIDCDNRISLNDFIEITAKKFYKKHTKEEIREAFRKFDKNDSGSISPEELRAALSKMGRLYSKEEVAKLIDSVDKDKNGQISIEEFARLLN